MISTWLSAALARRNIHYGWVMVGVTFLTALISAGTVGAPGVFIVPLQEEFGWTTAEISSALSIRFILFGLMAPFAAALMNRYGLRNITLLRLPDSGGAAQRFVQSPELARCFPSAFGVVLDDDAMEPMFAAGDALLVATGAEPQVGRPALCKFADQADDRCRIWLGEEGEHIQLGRVSDGVSEQMPRAQLRWALEVLYRVAPAA